MARQVIEKLIDDIDGGHADETVKFGLDGAMYEIDLSKKNADKLRKAVAPFVTVGSKVGRGGVEVGGRAARGRFTAPTDREQNQAIRAWAKKEGKVVSDRGRLSQEIVDEYHARAGR